MAKVILSSAIQQLSGKAGTTVFVKGRSAQIMKARTKGKNPKTAAQTAVRNNHATSARAYKAMTPAQLANWGAYAATLTKKNKITGQSYTPTAINAFTGLADKFLQITPGGAIPMTPPVAGFNGDTPTISAAGGVGQVTFTASAANAAGVKTELLVQPLKSSARTPSARGYRTNSFFAFAPGTLSKIVSLPSGNYALAARFVQTATGAEVAIQPLGKFQVS